MKKYLSILLVFFISGVLHGQWQVYTADVMPTESDPAFSLSCNTPGPQFSASVVSDPDLPGNTLLYYSSPDIDGKLAYKVVPDPWAGFTAIMRLKGLPNVDTLDALFDLEIRNGDSGFREKVFFNYDNTVELDNAGSVADVDIHTWHTYRITMSGTQVRVYVDENPLPILSGTTGNTTSNYELKIGDCSGSNSQGALIDWMIWSGLGAFTPGQGPAIPAGLEVDGDGSFNPGAYRIAFLTAMVDSNGFLVEQELISDLRQRGFQVDVTYNNPSAIFVPVDFDFSFPALSDYDLVILGRGCNSADFVNAEEWAAVETPILTFSAYLMRNSRLQLVNTPDAFREVADGTTVDKDRVTPMAINQGHPIFSGMDDDQDGEIGYHKWFYDYIGYGADTFELHHNATLIGSIQAGGGPGDGTVAAAIWNSGVETYPGGVLLGGQRAIFLMGSDDASNPKIQNFYAFSAEGTLFFHNLIKLLVGATPDGEEIPLSGPVAHFAMEGTGTVVADLIGGANGSLQNGNGCTREDCGVNNSLSFANASSAEAIVWVDDAPTLDFDYNAGFSIALWAKINPFSNTDEMTLLLKGDNMNDGTHLPDGNGHWWGLSTKAGQLRFIIDDDVTKSEVVSVLDETVFPSDQWNHIAGVLDANADSLFLYLNGVRIAGAPNNTNTSISTKGLPLVIGNYHSVNRKTNGNLDEVLLYDRILSPAAVETLFSAYSPTAACNVLETISQAGDNAWLASLSVDIGTLNPMFDPGIPNYLLQVPAGTTEIQITATADDPNALISGDGLFTSIPGNATITVTAENIQNEKVYTISVVLEGQQNKSIAVIPGYGNLGEAIKLASPGDTLILQNGKTYSQLEPHAINRHLVIRAAEIPALPYLENMPVITNPFGAATVFDLNYGGYLELIGIDVNANGGKHIFDCQGEVGSASIQSLYVNRCRLHNTTDDILKNAAEGGVDQTQLEQCIVKNSFIYDSGAGHGLYVQNYYGNSTFVFENLTIWNLGQQFNWIRHYPAGTTQSFVYDHITGYQLSTNASQNKELFGNADDADAASLDIQLKNSVFHTQVSTNTGSFKFDNSSGNHQIRTNNNVLFQVQPIVDLGGAIEHVDNLPGIDPTFRNPQDGDFTVLNEALWNAADDGEIVGATYWHPDFVDDYSDIVAVEKTLWIEESLVVQAYPNPVTDQLIFDMTLENPGLVSLQVVDQLGRLQQVVTVDKPFGAGQHTIQVSAKSWLPGIYFYRMTINGNVCSGIIIKKGK